MTWWLLGSYVAGFVLISLIWGYQSPPRHSGDLSERSIIAAIWPMALCVVVLTSMLKGPLTLGQYLRQKKDQPKLPKAKVVKTG